MGRLESFKNAAIEKGKELGASAWERAKDAGEKVAERVSGAAKEWKDDMVDTIKLKTVDKWQMIVGRKTENWLSNRKNSDIERVDGKIKDAEGKMSMKEVDFKREEETINATMEKINDPNLKKLFEDNKADKKAEMMKKIDDIKNVKLKKLNGCKETYLAQKEQYETKIKNIEKRFTDKIDGKIEDIKNKRGYEGKMENKKVLDENIRNLSGKLAEKEKTLTDYETALGSKGLLTKEYEKRLKEMAKGFKADIKKDRKELARAEKAQDKNDNQIGKINRKTDKWETLKTKYGLNKGEEVATEEGADKSGKENTPVVEPDSITGTEVEKPEGETTPTEKKAKHEAEPKKTESDTEHEVESGLESEEENEKEKTIKILKKIEALCNAYQRDFELENNYKGVKEASEELEEDDPFRKLMETMGRPKNLKLGMRKIGDVARAMREAYE